MVILKVNDKVIYIKDKKKIIYIIKEIFQDEAFIKGLNYRISLFVKISDLKEASLEEENQEKELLKKYYVLASNKERSPKKYLLGKILHIDGDKEYLDKCMELYNEIGVYAYGVFLEERKMPELIGEYLDKINPDIIVITGHDLYNQQGLKNIENYTNTKYYMETVKVIRKRKSSYECCVIAGACQSNYEALIASGADIASSPKRINVHTFDPAVFAIKVATTSFLKTIDYNEIYKKIENGRNAFGGVETLGKMKLML